MFMHAFDGCIEMKSDLKQRVYRQLDEGLKIQLVGGFSRDMNDFILFMGIFLGTGTLDIPSSNMIVGGGSRHGHLIDTTAYRFSQERASILNSTSQITCRTN